MHSFIQLLAIALFPLILYSIIRLNGGSDREVGILSTVLFLFQVLAAPIDLVAPILFSHWARQSRGNSVDGAVPVLRRGVPWMVFATLPAMVAVYFLLPMLLGAAYESARLPGTFITASLTFIFVSRICAPALFAAGAPHIVSWMWVLRLIGTVSLSAACIKVFPDDSPLIIALAWLFTEFLVGFLALFALKQQRLRIGTGSR